LPPILHSSDRFWTFADWYIGTEKVVTEEEVISEEEGLDKVRE